MDWETDADPDCATSDEYRRVVERLPLGVNVYRLEQPDDPGSLRFVIINPAADELTASPMRQYLGQTLRECMPAALETEAPQACVRAIRTQTIQQLPSFEYNDPSIPGAGRIYSVRAVPLGGPLVAVLFEDMTERVGAERAVHRLNRELAEKVEERELAIEELESFAYSVSHDLRQPLRAMDGFSKELVLQYNDRLDDRGRHYVERVRAGAQRMSRLIDEMLALSRINQHELLRVPVDLAAIVRELVAGLREADPGREVELDVPASLVVEADRTLCEVLLQNLIDNAWKFSAGTSIARITLGVADGEAGPEYFVRDNGVGFDMAYVDKLFGAFQRLHTVAEFAGIGIGLATVQRIARRHGGSVRAHARPDEGATIYFTLGPAESRP